MRGFVVSVLIGLSATLLSAAQTSPEQATIEQTGSTNTLGVRMTVTPGGTAHVQQQGLTTRETNVQSQLSQRLFEDLKTVGPLSDLPKTHCVKSVSFGTSLYLKYNGQTSPDLSCPAPPDSKVAILKKDVRDLMQAAHATPPIGHRIIAAPAVLPH